jgi:hypothetical protein
LFNVVKSWKKVGRVFFFSFWVGKLTAAAAAVGSKD